MYRIQVNHAGFARVLYSEAPRHEPRIEENESWYSLDAREEREALLEAQALLVRERGGYWYFYIAGELFANGDRRDVSLTSHWDRETCFRDVDNAMVLARPRSQVFSRYR